MIDEVGWYGGRPNGQADSMVMPAQDETRCRNTEESPLRVPGPDSHPQSPVRWLKPGSRPILGRHLASSTLGLAFYSRSGLSLHGWPSTAITAGPRKRGRNSSSAVSVTSGMFNGYEYAQPMPAMRSLSAPQSPPVVRQGNLSVHQVKTETQSGRPSCSHTGASPDPAASICGILG